MRSKLLILVLLGLPVIGISQSISVSPMSIRAWGRVPDVSAMSIEYKDFGIHYFHVHESRHFGRSVRGIVTLDGGFSQSAFAVSYKPVKIGKVFKGGVLLSNNRFPTDKSNRVNFILDVGYPLFGARLSYVHVSNGFGIFNRVNPGLDRIKLTIPL